MVFFINRSQVHITAQITYANMICGIRPLKPDPRRVRLTVGGDILEYAGDHYQYIRIASKYVTEEIRNEYDISSIE